MKLENLTLSNFRSYQHAEIDLTGIRLASIVGSNGAGKSSLMDAALFALTGAKTRGDLNGWIRDGEEECRVSAIFSTAGQRYRSTRTRSNRNKGTSTAELAREEQGQWVPDTTGANAVDARVEELLGVNEELLLMTSLIPQAEANSFLEKTPGKRLEALASILKLDAQYGPVERYWKAEGAEAKAALEDARRDIERLEKDVDLLGLRQQDLTEAQITLGAFRERLAGLEQQLTEARENARVAQDGVRDSEEAHRHLAELRRRRDDLQAREHSLCTDWNTLGDRIAGRDRLEADLASRPALQTELASLEEAEREDARLNQQRAVANTEIAAAQAAITSTVNQGKPKAAELETLLGRRSSLQARIKAIEDAETPSCDRCGQPIADEALARTLDQLRSENDEVGHHAALLGLEVQALREQLFTQKAALATQEETLAAIPENAGNASRVMQIKLALEKLDTIPAKLAEITVCEERRETIGAELVTLQDEIGDPAFTEELAAVETAVAMADSAKDAALNAALTLEAADRTVTVARRDLSAQEATVARHEEAVAMLRPSRIQLTEAQQQCRELEQDQADADLLAYAWSKWGIPALIVGNVVRSLEREVNELLGLYSCGMTVRFESQRETGNGARDSLEIIVDRDGASRGYESYSGGEKYRVACCVRLGLSLLLAHRSGAKIETLILDEPEGLDAEGRQHLVTVLVHLGGQFELILLISHHEDLQEAFPSQIMVSRGDDGLSQVEVAA